MVNSYYIIQLKAVPQTGNPPLVISISVIIPTIQRIAPKLSVCGESIRRASCNCSRHIVFIQLKQLRVSPCVRTVHCYINRNISDNLDTLTVRIRFELIPLLKEFKLQILLEFNIKIQLLAIIIQRIAISQTDIFRPLGPCMAVKTVFQCHKQRIIGQPPLILCHKLLVLLILADVASLICFAKKRETFLIQFLIIDIIFFLSEICRITLFFRQNTFFDQCLQTDKIWISGKSRKRLIRGIPVAGRSDRQNLPVGLSRLLQPVYKTICFL